MPIICVWIIKFLSKVNDEHGYRKYMALVLILFIMIKCGF